MTARLVVGAISADAHRLASNLMHGLLRDAPVNAAQAAPWHRAGSPARARKTSLLSFTRMLASAAEQSGRDHLGLDMAGAESDPARSIFGELFLYAPTVGHALQALTRYFPVSQTGTTVSLTQADNTARLAYLIHDPAVAERLQDAAYTLGKIYRSLRRSVGHACTLDHVMLAAPAPRQQAPYQRFFDAPVTFGAASTALCFNTRVLAQPIATANAARYQAFCLHLAQHMPQHNEPDLLEDALRAWMNEAARWGDATLTQAAADFGVTPRTLQRRLKERGVSFQPLLAEVRMQNAERMLRESALPVTQIAEQLGFSEISAFTRAFRSHAQQSPRAFRQAQPLAS